MNIWKWIDDLEPELRTAGHQHLAELMRELPRAAASDRHDRVDALAPVALALARAARLPWVEVFVRHWHLQSRVLHRAQGDMALGEAVALVDFSHGEAARGCPQAVCTVQDLAACYAWVDGPGYAPERIAVSRETLSRIDPSWPCYACISNELAGALRDQGAPQACIDFLDEQRRVMAPGRHELLPQRIGALIELGRVEEALVACQEAIAHGRGDDHGRRARRIDLARIYARMGRADDAMREVPVPEDILPLPALYGIYTDAVVQLVAIGARPNDRALDRLLQRFITRLEAQGSFDRPFQIAAEAVELACRRGSPAVARLHVATMERLATKLRRPPGRLDRLARARLSLETAERQPVAVRPSDPEDILRIRAAASAARPNDRVLARRHAAALFDLGFASESAALLERLLAERADLDVARLLENAYLAAGESDRHRALGERLLAAGDDASRRVGRWISARRLARLGDFAGSNEHLVALATDERDAVAARLFLASNARAQRDWPAVLRLIDEVLALDPNLGGGGHHWERMLAATLLGAWDKVRDSAARLGMTIAGDAGPIDERWEPCKIRVVHPDGELQDLWARRSGPCTAKLLQISALRHPQRYGDRVAFDTLAVDDVPGLNESDPPVMIYAELATLARGGCFAFRIDGVHPGEPALAGLRRVVEAHRGALQLQSDASDRVVSPEGAEHPGLCALIVYPAEVELARAAAALDAHARTLPGPLMWPELAEAAGDDETCSRHRMLVGAWGLDS